jgi:zinc/manganese transport system permease protein
MTTGDMTTWWSLLWPAAAAGILVTLSHVPLGIRVLERGIVFIDLAIAQVAGLGVILADWLGFAPLGWAAQGCAFGAALAGALLLDWTDGRWPEVQEAIIGTVFVLAASGALLLLALDPHGGEHLKSLLEGQILWVGPKHVAAVALAYAVLASIAGAARARSGSSGFYLLFACTVTISVQLVGLYLVFATLIVPALATRRMTKWRMATGHALGVGGYALGLVLSAAFDLPAGPAIVWSMTSACLAFAFAWAGTQPRSVGRQPTP